MKPLLEEAGVDPTVIAEACGQGPMPATAGHSMTTAVADYWHGRTEHGGPDDCYFPTLGQAQALVEGEDRVMTPPLLDSPMEGTDDEGRETLAVEELFSEHTPIEQHEDRCCRCGLAGCGGGMCEAASVDSDGHYPHARKGDL